MNSAPKEIYDAVKKEYLATVMVPDKKSGQQFFLCPVGFTGAGKSSVLNLLEKHFSFVRLSTDDVRKLFREHGYGQPGSTEAKELFDELVEKFSSEGYNIEFDSNCGNAKDMIEARATRISAKVVWIHINPPEEFIINKLKNYKHTWLYRDGDHAVERYFHHKERAPKTKFPFLFEFDTSKSDLPEQVERCARLIKQEIERHIETQELKNR